MKAACLVLLVGCNQVYGLESTQLIDAQLFDAAPPRCPPPGVAPAFDPSLRQVSTRDCVSYTRSATGALAKCGLTFYEGTGDLELTEVRGMMPSAGLSIDYARLAPEADIAFARQFTPAQSFFTSIYRRIDGVWQHESDVLPGNRDEMGTPSRAPMRRMFGVFGTTLTEYDEARGWAVHETYSPGNFNVASFSAEPPQLSPDGLRLLFAGTTTTNEPRLFFAQRDSIDARFTAAHVITDVPVGIREAVMTEDCSRIYFPAIGVIFYLEQ